MGGPQVKVILVVPELGCEQPTHICNWKDSEKDIIKSYTF
jgi:hypothetical protein